MVEKWIKDCIEGPGGLLNFEKYEWAVRNDTDEMVAASWIIRCLANPSCEGSEDVFKAIEERREEMKKSLVGSTTRQRFDQLFNN